MGEMLIIELMLIIGYLIYLLFFVLIVKSLYKNKKKQRLYSMLFAILPFFIATLNYQGFCFKKMRFLNEQDIYRIVKETGYRTQSNECYGAYVFVRKKMYGNFKTDLENAHLYESFDTFVKKILGWRYAMVQTKRGIFIMENCGNLYSPALGFI